VDYVHVDGGGGAGAASSGVGGAGAQVSTDLLVIPGETLYTVVGAPGVGVAGGYNGGGGYPDGQRGQPGNAGGFGGTQHAGGAAAQFLCNGTPSTAGGLGYGGRGIDSYTLRQAIWVGSN
jgi:hypothetical protein